MWGEWLMGLFDNNPEVIRQGHEYLIIVSSFYIVFSSMFVMHGMLRGAGDTLIPMFITLISLWLIRIPLPGFYRDTWEKAAFGGAYPVAGWWDWPAPGCTT